jgi:hypothetical protein
MKPNEFKKLQDEWYQKIKKDGFIDIENESKGDENIKPKDYFFEDNVINYFKLCQEFLAQKKIKSHLNRFIFEKHCEGVSNRNIAKLLESHGFKPLTSRTIDRRLHAILAEAGIEPIEFKK